MLAVDIGARQHRRVGGKAPTLLFLFSWSGCAWKHKPWPDENGNPHCSLPHAPKFATALDDQGSEREVPVEESSCRHLKLSPTRAQFPVTRKSPKASHQPRRIQSPASTPVGKKCRRRHARRETINIWGAVESSRNKPAPESFACKNNRPQSRTAKPAKKRPHSGSPTKWTPFTPTSSWGALAMYSLVMALGLTTVTNAAARTAPFPRRG